MPRSSRHKSHRPHKHSSRDARERSDSEEEESSKGRRERDEVAGSGSGGRASRSSRDLDVEKRKESPALQAAAEGDGFATVNADLSVEHGKKRKERPLDLLGAADRWNGDGTAGFEEKDMKVEEFLDEEKMPKSRLSGSESKSRSSRRYENSTTDRKDESGVRDEPSKRRSEKDPIDLKENDRERGLNRDRDRASDRDSAHGSVKHRGRGFEKDYRPEHDSERGPESDRDRGSERDREHASERNKELDREERSRRDKERLPDMEWDRHSEKDGGSNCKHEKPSDASNQNVRMCHIEADSVVKGNLENADVQILDDVVNPDIEKDLRKRIKTDGSSDKDKWQGDGRGIDDRKFVPDGLIRNGGYKDEKYLDLRYREKSHEDFDRDKSARIDKHRDERSSKGRGSDRSDNKYYKDTNRPSENHSKSKNQDNDRESSYIKERNTRYMDSRGKKRSAEQNDRYFDVKSRYPKESRSSIEKISSENSKLDSSDDKGRPESIHSNRVDATPNHDRQRNSPASAGHVILDEYSSKQAESIHRSISREKHHTSSASSGELASVSVVAERVLESHSVESASKPKEANSGDYMVEDAPVRTPRSDGHASAGQLSEKSPVTSDLQHSSRRGGRRNLDIDEVGQKSSSSKDGREHSTKERERSLSAVKPYVDDGPQMQFPSSEITRSVSSSYNRADHMSSSSPSRLPPTPPVRHGTDSISILGSGEDFQGGDHKGNSRYRRSVEPNLSRGQGNVWNGVPNWPSPVPNGFISFQHGPPGGFHPVPQQFPASSMFGVRPFMDFNHGGVPFHMHDTSDRFSSHSRPFGWRNPSDDSCPPHVQCWEGNNGVFGNDPHMYGRSEWEHNRHLFNNRGWEMSGGPWKGQNGSTSMEFSDSQKAVEFPACPPADDARIEQPGSQHRSEQFQLEPVDIKQLVDTPTKGTPETLSKKMSDKSPEASKPIDNGASFCSTYLSKLDISLDLARPDLYNHCIKMIETEGDKVSSNKVPSTRLLRAQDPCEGFKLAVRNCNQVGRPLFPTITDAVFKKAFSLYKKTSGGQDKAPPTIFQSKEVPNSLETLDIQTIGATERDFPETPDVVKSVRKEDLPQSMEVNVDPVEDELSKAMDVEDVEPVEVPEGDAMLIANPSSNMEEGSNNASDSRAGADSNNGSDLGGDLLASVQEKLPEMIFTGDNSQGCEGLMLGCLSRIPKSRESTH